jgi:integrase/recombinase XerC
VFRDGRPKRRLLLSVFKGAGKAGGVQEVLLSESLRGKLRRFRAWKAREREPLTTDRRPALRQPTRPKALAQAGPPRLHRVAARAGLERRVTFRMPRHTACSNLYALSKSVRLTQRLARHRSLVATMVYTHPSEDDLMRALRHVLWIENMPLEL